MRHSLDSDKLPSAGATVPEGCRPAATVLGGEDAAYTVAGPTTTGASCGIHCRSSPPTVSNCHVLRNLSVGMEGGGKRVATRSRSPSRRRHQTHDRQKHLRRPLSNRDRCVALKDPRGGNGRWSARTLQAPPGGTGEPVAASMSSLGSGVRGQVPRMLLQKRSFLGIKESSEKHSEFLCHKELSVRRQIHE